VRLPCNREDDEKCRDCEIARCPPLRRIVVSRPDIAADSFDDLDALRSLLPICGHFDLKCHTLTGFWPPGARRESFDMHEDLLAPVKGLNEPKAAIIVPGFYRAFDSHDVRLSFNVKNLPDRRKA
jgi:hypothetical protein